ncbi:hypothetical protein EVAR_23038_1 [Eumeta japonica]|uniref:Uncharacterized protein n=1 Tax=Eumeta variegata TaxID=151549 RepID=A0A4C1UQ33_EUMVA|nr:hypothetical protein EVAR_23038_1 [Eumeta japonica]
MIAPLPLQSGAFVSGSEAAFCTMTSDITGDVSLPPRAARRMKERPRAVSALIALMVITAAYGHSQSQRSHQCIAGTLGKVIRSLMRVKVGHRNSHSLDEMNSRSSYFTFGFCKNEASQWSRRSIFKLQLIWQQYGCQTNCRITTSSPSTVLSFLMRTREVSFGTPYVCEMMDYKIDMSKPTEEPKEFGLGVRYTLVKCNSNQKIVILGDSDRCKGDT